MKKGLLIINTGNGKGKTTASLGMAFRALGHGFKVCVIQFIKGSWKYGELESARRFKDLMDFHVMGGGFTKNSKDRDKDRELGRKAWEFAREAILSGKYKMVILDELTYLIKYRMVDEDEVVDFLIHRPRDLHVVVTGRNATRSLMEAADMVTEMKALKHPYKSGVKAQRGIEF